MADVKNFGLKGVSADVQLGKAGGRFKWSSANDRYEFMGSDGSTLKAIRAGNVDVQGTLLSDDITSSAVTVNGDATITGNLTVNGATTTVSSTNTTVNDTLFVLADGQTSGTNDSGILIDRGSDANVFIGWDESADAVVVGTGTFAGDATGDLTFSAAAFTAGAITGSSFTGASGASITAFLDEDNMSSDSDTAVPTQQSVKAYVDGEVTTLNSTITTANSNMLTYVDNANTEMKAYVDALDRDDDLGVDGDSGTFLLDLDASNLTLAGGTGITSTAGSNTVTFNLDNTAVSAGDYGSATQIPTFTVDAQGRITAASNTSISTSWTLTGDSGSETVNGGDTVLVAGGTNITTAVTATDTVTVNLDNDITLSGNVDAVDGTFTGTVSFGTLTDSGESISVTKFVDEADGISSNDNDTTIPTSAAVKDYVDNNGGDGLTLRASFTANSSDSTFDIGTVPNVSGRTYYASRVILDVTTLLAGGSVDGMVVVDNAGGGNTLAAASSNDIAVGTYVVDLPFSSSLTKNAAVQVQFVQSDGSTAATPTGGVVVGVVEYKYV
jgi:hypothetical protein